MFVSSVVPPNEHITFLPLAVPLPVSSFEDCILSFSGLDQSEACWVRRLIRALGGTTAQNFSRKAHYLICPSMTGKKYEKAKEWGVPVVGMEWLERVAREGIVPAVVEEVGGDIHMETTSSWEDLYGPRSQPQPHSLPDSGKGKGKALQNEAKIVDITNSKSTLFYFRLRHAD